jgi:hypothetical protein
MNKLNQRNYITLAVAALSAILVASIFAIGAHNAIAQGGNMTGGNMTGGNMTGMTEGGMEGGMEGGGEGGEGGGEGGG